MLGIQRRMAVVCILESRNSTDYYGVFLIGKVCEVKCSIEGLSILGDRRILSTSLPSSRDQALQMLPEGAERGRYRGRI
jgi:hypothetical protein